MERLKAIDGLGGLADWPRVWKRARAQLGCQEREWQAECQRERERLASRLNCFDSSEGIDLYDSRVKCCVVRLAGGPLRVENSSEDAGNLM